MAADPADILNWRVVDARLSLSGQPSADAFAALQQAGVEAIINLAPQDNDTALIGEGDLISNLGMAYTYIPVDFENPTEQDYAKFCNAMAAADGKRVHIHCIYNARVTAFMLRYAVDGLGGTVEEAEAMMDSIWRPGGVWATFIGKDADIDQPNRYLGYEY